MDSLSPHRRSPPASSDETAARRSLPSSPRRVRRRSLSAGRWRAGSGHQSGAGVSPFDGRTDRRGSSSRPADVIGGAQHARLRAGNEACSSGLTGPARCSAGSSIVAGVLPARRHAASTSRGRHAPTRRNRRGGDGARRSRLRRRRTDRSSTGTLHRDFVEPPHVILVGRKQTLTFLDAHHDTWIDTPRRRSNPTNRLFAVAQNVEAPRGDLAARYASARRCPCGRITPRRPSSALPDPGVRGRRPLRVADPPGSSRARILHGRSHAISPRVDHPRSPGPSLTAVGDARGAAGPSPPVVNQG
jgi:hypothetical protein